MGFLLALDRLVCRRPSASLSQVLDGADLDRFGRLPVDRGSSPVGASLEVAGTGNRVI